MVPTMRGVFRTQSNIYDVHFYKNSKGFQLLIIFAESSIPDVWLGSEYVSEVRGNKITEGFRGSNLKR